MNKKILAYELAKVASVLIGMEFDSEDELKKYLQDHPDADKSNHTVKKKEPSTKKQDKHIKNLVEEKKPDGGVVRKYRDTNQGVDIVEHLDKDGKLHNDKGPAKEMAGAKFYFKHGVPHRDDGPSAEGNVFQKTWHKDGKLHREDGPAIEKSTGEKLWYKDDQLHNDNGPAYTDANGKKQYFIKGEKVSEKKFKQMKKGK